MILKQFWTLKLLIQDYNMKTYFAHETASSILIVQLERERRVWHFSHIMKNATLGKGCNVGQNVVVSPGVVLGNNVKVQNNVSIYTGVTCEDDVFLGPSMVFTNVINPRSAIIRRDEFMQTKVGKGASIGANATIVCGNDYWSLFSNWSWGSNHKRSTTLCLGCWKSC